MVLNLDDAAETPVWGPMFMHVQANRITNCSLVHSSLYSASLGVSVAWLVLELAGDAGPVIDLHNESTNATVLTHGCAGFVLGSQY